MTGINNNDWIVGDAFNSVTGITTAYLLAPVPEPEIYAMLFAGLGVVGFVAARRRNT